MRKVLYILGAGFSAPLGIPVVRDFLFKAREQFASDTHAFEGFRPVLDAINELARAKNYIDLDLFNIEEVFSIIEMRGRTSAAVDRHTFQDFIRSVITHHTPQLRSPLVEASPTISMLALTRSSVSILLGTLDSWRGYVAFAASLLGLRLDSGVLDLNTVLRPGHLTSTPLPDGNAQYYVVSFNYDRVLEQALAFLRASLPPTRASSPTTFPIAKLHGDVEGEIVPPTWRKDLPDHVQEAWSNAHEWIATANEIRFLGYSIPSTDMYIKYLLSAAFMDVSNLQQIDAICLDPDGTVEKRYRSLIQFPRFRFRSGNIADLLSRCAGVGHQNNPYRAEFTLLEALHQDFMESG